MTTFAALMQFLMNDGNTYMIPTSIKEVKESGWDYIDVILFTGDSFIVHPSFGTAVIARWLQKHGYRVAVVPHPNWRDDLRDLRKLGAPRLYIGIGGIEASLRRVTHYDYWQDSLKPSILIDSGADWLCYGMGERTMIEFARSETGMSRSVRCAPADQKNLEKVFVERDIERKKEQKSFFFRRGR
jgi:hypothetical protein